MHWRLSPAEFDVVWEELALGELPYPLEVAAHGATLEDRTELRVAVLAGLDAAGLRPGGTLDAGLAAALTVLARPDFSVDSVWLPGPEARTPCRVLAARTGPVAHLLAQDADPAADLLVGEIRPTALEQAVVDWLPGAPGGAQSPISVPVPAASGADEGGSVLVGERPGPGAGRGERAYAGLATQPRLAAGQLAVNTRLRHGRVRRSAVLHWFDVVDDGRYLAYREDGYVTVRPVDPARLHDALTHPIPRE